MPSSTQWKTFHFLNREGKLNPDWDKFGTMTENEARKYLNSKIERKVVHKQLTRRQRRLNKIRGVV